MRYNLLKMRVKEFENVDENGVVIILMTTKQ